MNRKSPYSQVYKLATVAEGITVMLPMVEDLDDEHLQWHYQFGLDKEDYEYAQAVWQEAERRGLRLLTPPFSKWLKTNDMSSKWCRKIGYSSRKAAKAALVTINRWHAPKKGEHRLTDVYYCEECMAWHHTSMPKSQSRRLTKLKKRR